MCYWIIVSYNQVQPNKTLDVRKRPVDVLAFFDAFELNDSKGR